MYFIEALEQTFFNVKDAFLQMVETQPWWYSVIMTVLAAIILYYWSVMLLGFFVFLLGIKTYGPLGWIQENIDNYWERQNYIHSAEYKWAEKKRKEERDRKWNEKSIKETHEYRQRVAERKAYKNKHNVQ